MADREAAQTAEGGPGQIEQTDPVLDLRVPEPLIDLSGAPTVELTAPPDRDREALVAAMPSAADYQIIGATGIDAIERRDSLYRARYVAVKGNAPISTPGPDHASSACVFSGLDAPDDFEMNPPGFDDDALAIHGVQSYGVFVSQDLKAEVPSPGEACRGNLPPETEG